MFENVWEAQTGCGFVPGMGGMLAKVPLGLFATVLCLVRSPVP